MSLLELREGSRAAGQARADAIAVDLALDRADLNKVLGAQRPGRGGDADIPLALDPAPDPVITAKLAFGTLAYARMRASDVRLAVGLQPGRIALDELALTTSGAQVTAAGMALGLGKGARIGAEVTMLDADLDMLRRDLGLRELPLSGRLTGEVSVAAEGETLNAAARGARVSAVVAMRQGSIAQEVVEMASLDLRLLFRDPQGRTPVSCLLGVLDMHGGIGTLAPLRIRAASGTIGGLGRFDLNRKQVDLVIGSLAATTGSFALDIPVRVSGAFASPSIRPAEWSAAGRRTLAARDDVAPLPPRLRVLRRAQSLLPGGALRGGASRRNPAEQRLDLRRGIAGIGQHAAGIGRKPRRQRQRIRPGGGEGDRPAEAGHGALGRMHLLPQQPDLPEMRVVEQPVDGGEGHGGDLGAAEDRRPFGGGPGAQRLGAQGEIGIDVAEAGDHAS